MIGQYDRALPATKKSVELDPTSAPFYANLASTYAALNRFDDARSTIEQARKRNLESVNLHIWEYQLAFLRSDTDGMAQQVAWGMGKPGFEDAVLGMEADTAAYSGKLNNARELTQRATTIAQQHQDKEGAAFYQASSALREALFANRGEARKSATVALDLSRARNVQPIAALALAFAGETVRAETLAADLGRRFPEDTIINFSYLPTIHAVVEVSQGNPSKAVEILQVTASFELGTTAVGLALHPLFVRGEAFLIAHQGSEAAAEFQKIIDHRGVALNAPIGALAHLGLARAYSLQGETAKAKAAYQDFLTLWKDADPEIPILKQAKAEYAKLQ